MKVPWRRRGPATSDSDSKDEVGGAAASAVGPVGEQAGSLPREAETEAALDRDADVTSVTSAVPNCRPRAAEASTADESALLRVAEEAWRLGRRLDRATSEVGEECLTDVRDALQRLRDVLSEAGVEAVEHDGERYVDGLRLHVLHVEGESNDDAPLRVVRTVRPSILMNGQVALGGQVILGPAEQENTTP